MLGLNKCVVTFPIASHKNFSVNHRFGYLISCVLIIQILSKNMINATDQEGKQFELLKVNRYEVEQNAVFLDYSLQALTSQIQKYSEAKFQMRLSLSKNLKTIEEVLKDNKPLLQKLLDQLMQSQLLYYFRQKSPFQKLGADYKQLILNPMKNLASGTFLQIKQQSCKLISELAHSIDIKDLDQIVQFANGLSKSDNQENKIVAIQLLARLTHVLPVDKRQSIFLNQFLSLYSGSSVRVKKQVILELGKLSQHLTPQFVDNKIIKGFFLKESKQNAWGIRKACVQVIVELLTKAKTTKQQLCNILMGLLKDGNKFVRIAAHKIVPQFVAKYNDKNIPKAIFDIYLSLIDLDINNQVSKQNQIVQRVSFYFPGVLQTVGASKWPQMNNLFNRLLHNRSEEVKRPLADSLHIIAQIIGPINSKQYLFSSLDYILREQMDTIKLCAIRNLSKFVAQFETQTKQNLIDVFLVLQKDPKKWRVRYLISSQLKFLSEIYDADTNFKYLFPISLKLCNDQVSEVRKCASQQIIFVVNQLKKEQSLYKMALESLVGYAASQKYLQRQTFCLMLQNLYKYSQKFEQNFLEPIKKLCQDEIPLVQIALAIAISNIVKMKKQNYENFKQCIQKLSKNAQVQQYLQEVKLLCQG